MRLNKLSKQIVQNEKEQGEYFIKRPSSSLEV